jgi:hypothetical protein
MRERVVCPICQQQDGSAQIRKETGNHGEPRGTRQSEGRRATSVAQQSDQRLVRRLGTDCRKDGFHAVQDLCLGRTLSAFIRLHCRG